MNARTIQTLLLVTASLGLWSCSGDKDAGASGAPAGSSAPAGSGAAAASGAPAATKFSGKTVHVKRTQGECTFDFDSPEEMKEKTKDGMSFTLESASFSFVGFDGTTLHSKPEHALDLDKSFKEVYRGTENGVQLTVVIPVKYERPVDVNDVSGMGGEPYSNERSLGCTFLCGGARDRQADAIAMCKSVRITVTPEKKP